MYRSKFIAISGIFLFLSLFTLDARAHYMWLNVNDYTPGENRTANFSIGWGHAFYNPVMDVLYGRELLGKTYMIGPDGKEMKVNALNEFQYASADKLSQGTYIAMVHRKEGFSTKTTHGYVRKPRKGLKDVIYSRYLGMYGKAIINVGASTDNKSFRQPVGIPLEIVPMVNPSHLKTGDYFKFKLLYQGKPLTENINASYAGFSYDNAWAFTTRTKKSGIGEIKILNAGIWVIKANHKAPYPEPDKADEYSYTTSLTFEVR
jgi:uncharacterized GH25 family protein